MTVLNILNNFYLNFSEFELSHKTYRRAQNSWLKRRRWGRGGEARVNLFVPHLPFLRNFLHSLAVLILSCTFGNELPPPSTLALPPPYSLSNYWAGCSFIWQVLSWKWPGRGRWSLFSLTNVVPLTKTYLRSFIYFGLSKIKPVNN